MFFKLAPVIRKPPPGTGRMNMPGLSGGLGLTEATSNVNGVVAGCPKTLPARQNQRLRPGNVVFIADVETNRRAQTPSPFPPLLRACEKTPPLHGGFARTFA